MRAGASVNSLTSDRLGDLGNGPTFCDTPRRGGCALNARNPELEQSTREPIVNIDIDKLTEAELIDLNNRIVERLRFLGQMRAHGQMLQFKIGDRVSFRPEGRPVVVGMLTRYNRRTVTVITDSGQRWNVSPTLLTRADSSAGAHDSNPNVIRIPKR
jgi:hypothetical protein